MKTIAVVGAGLMGRLVALFLHRQGYHVTLFDKDSKRAKNSAAYAAAGLLTPLGEAPQCEKNIVEMGFTSLKLWPEILATLDTPVFFQQEGSLLVSHEQDQGDYQRFDRFIKQYYPDADIHNVNREALLTLEPELSRSFNQGIFLPDEGQIDNVQLLNALAYQLEKEDVNWFSETFVEDMHCHGVERNQGNKNPESTKQRVSYRSVEDRQPRQSIEVDLIIDCRGVGAKQEPQQTPNQVLAGLRGVRGEVFKLYAPDVSLTRPIRLMHPRYQIYIAPKENGYVSVGATQIESDDSSPITVRSALELLSATYSVCSGFAEANILEQISQLRPAFHDNQPQVIANKGLIQVNGLFRHGYLISPVVLQQVLELVDLYKRSAVLDTACRYSQLLPIQVLCEAAENEIAL